jgi:hypothetical protein
MEAPMYVTRPDVRALVRAVAPVSSAIVPVAELYQRYAAMMDEQDRVPVSQKAFGQALDRCGQRSISRRVDGRNTRCRVIHQRWLPPEEDDHRATPA